MLGELQNEFDESVKKIAENKLINKLNLQGLKRADLSEEKYEQLLAMEIDILKNDGKKVGAGIGIGILFSVITGGLFLGDIMATHKTNLPARYEEKEESLGSFLWQITKLFTKCTWYGSKFVVKNAPAAIGMAWEIKKEITKGVAQGLHEAKQTYKEMLIEQEIAKLTEQKMPSSQIELNSVRLQEVIRAQRDRQKRLEMAMESSNKTDERQAYDARLEKFRNL